MRREIAAGEQRRNVDRPTAEWLFTVDQARRKLKRLYPDSGRVPWRSRPSRCVRADKMGGSYGAILHSDRHWTGTDDVHGSRARGSAAPKLRAARYASCLHPTMFGLSQAAVVGPAGNSSRPARRPFGPPAGYQHWRRLFFAHWRVNSAALRPLVPDPLSIDDYDGSAYISLTPFVIEAARPFGAPPAVGLRFPETNVRTYVRLHGDEPGVYFLSMGAASLLAVTGARAGLGLPYFWATGRERLLRDQVDYTLRRRGCGVGCHVR